MSNPSIVERVLEIVIAAAGATRTPADAGPDTPLCDGGFWLDSIGLLETVLACEAEFKIDFDPATEISRTQEITVRTLVAIIETRRSRP